jgi:uncharacterized pyridoxamine 5'-phosphate oxidase family protein
MVGIDKEVVGFMQEQEFLFVGTADNDCRPNTSAKILLKINQEYVYLVEYIKGRTFKNLTDNPRISLSAVNAKTIVGYRLYAEAVILTEGPEYDLLLKELNDKQIDVTAKSLISKLRKGVRSKSYAFAELVPVALIKAKIIEANQIMPTGQIRIEKVKKK